MEDQNEIFRMLDILQYPGFCVKEHQIVKVNSAAGTMPLRPGMDVRDFLATGREEYAAFTGGCLYLMLSFASKQLGATVLRMDETDLFLLDPQMENQSLQTLSLAAQSLRKPLSDMSVVVDKMFADSSTAGQERAASLNRSLHQMIRLVGNMSDARSIPDFVRLELRDLNAVFREVMDKAQLLLERLGVTLLYTPLEEPVYGLADGLLLERAVLNMLSNAVKFTAENGCITARLTRRDQVLRFSVEDSGSGISKSLLGTLYSRYTRAPGIEDSRFGIGLGLLIVRSAAASHGGAVLIDQPQDRGCRITLTIAIRKPETGTLHSPILLPDYTGGWDHALVELSECLPLSAYGKEK